MTVQKLVACDDSHLYSLGTQIALYIYTGCNACVQHPRLKSVKDLATCEDIQSEWSDEAIDI